MKKYIIFLGLFLTNIEIFAQDCSQKVQNEIIDKIKHYEPTNLLPYSENGIDWALIDKKSKKRVTDFVFSDSKTFYPNFKTYAFDCEIFIKPDYSFQSHRAKVEILPYEEEKTIATKEDLGFDVDEQGKMTAYSKSYRIQEYDGWNISQPILYNGKYYAILSKEDEKVLIDQKGIEQDAFRFKQMHSIDYKNKGEELFYVEDKQGNKGLITLSGRKILYGELLRPIYRDYLGYSIQYGGDYYPSDVTLSGVLDLVTQTWVIKPQKKYKIHKILYTSKEEIDSYKAENRAKTEIYFLVQKGKKRFVLDSKANPVLPKN